MGYFDWTDELGVGIKERVSRTGFVLTLEILDRFRDWMRNHFTSTDRHYASATRGGE